MRHFIEISLTKTGVKCGWPFTAKCLELELIKCFMKPDPVPVIGLRPRRYWY